MAPLSKYANGYSWHSPQQNTFIKISTALLLRGGGCQSLWDCAYAIIRLICLMIALTRETPNSSKNNNFKFIFYSVLLALLFMVLSTLIHWPVFLVEKYIYIYIYQYLIFYFIFPHNLTINKINKK